MLSGVFTSKLIELILRDWQNVLNGRRVKLAGFTGAINSINNRREVPFPPILFLVQKAFFKSPDQNLTYLKFGILTATWWAIQNFLYQLYVLFVSGIYIFLKSLEKSGIL